MFRTLPMRRFPAANDAISKGRLHLAVLARILLQPENLTRRTTKIGKQTLKQGVRFKFLLSGK